MLTEWIYSTANKTHIIKSKVLKRKRNTLFCLKSKYPVWNYLPFMTYLRLIDIVSIHKICRSAFLTFPSKSCSEPRYYHHQPELGALCFFSQFCGLSKIRPFSNGTKQQNVQTFALNIEENMEKLLVNLKAPLQYWGDLNNLDNSCVHYIFHWMPVTIRMIWPILVALLLTVWHT